MKSLRRYAYFAFVVACAHLVFGAIVRISGSGMGCGDHWPKCYGRWFPPLDRPDLIIEVSHRYLASILLLSLLALLVAAWRRRGERGVSGRGGIIRPAALAVTLGVSAALLGAVTVKLGNVPFATLAHWTVAMSLVATVVAALIRAGGLGGATARGVVVSESARRATWAAAAMALATVVMGGLTAKYPGAAVACPGFPLCGTNPDVQGAAVHVQLTHRVLAVLLVLHLVGVVMRMRKRGEPAIVRRAAHVALGLGVLQLLVAGAMIGMHLPPVLRSLHQAVGVSIWIATFALAYLARIGRNGHGVREPRVVPDPDDLVDAGVVRAGPAPVYATAVAEAPRRGVVQEKEPWQQTAELAEEWQAPVSAPSVAEVPVTTEDTGTEEGTALVAAPVTVDVPEVDVPRANAVPVAPAEAEAALPRAVKAVPHSVAVIIARGADL